MAAPESAIGLEIGAHYVKVVRLARRFGRYHLAAADLLRLPGDHANLADIIRRFLESKNLLHYPCAIGTPAYSCMLHTLDMAENDPRMEKDVVAIEIERLNQISEENMLYDFAKLPATTARQTLLIAMGRESAIERMLQIPDAIGLEVVSVVPTPVAVFNGSFPKDVPPGEVAICASISHAATHVAIGSRNRLLFSRHFDCGGDRFTDALARSLEIGAREAEDLKIQHGFSATAADPGAAARDALTDAANAWVGELQSTLAFYRERFPQEAEQPRSLVLSGGGSELKGFAEHIAGKLSLPVRPFEPPWSGRMPEGAARFAAAGGLAMGALPKSPIPLNLLPPRQKDALQLRAQIPYWKTVGVALSLAMLVAIAGRLADFRHKQTYAKSLTQRVDGFKVMDAELESLAKENARLGDRLRFAHRGVRDGMILRAVMGAIAGVMHRDDWLILVADSNSYFARNATPAAGSRQPAGDPASSPQGMTRFIDGIIVEGYTPREDFATVKTMIERLRQVPYVENVDLLTDDRVVHDPERNALWANVPARRFAVEVRIRQP